MKKKILPIILLIVGMFPLILPFLWGLYEIAIGSHWPLFDWLILYSYVYWPTYLIGIAFIITSVVIFILKKNTKS